MSLGCFFSFVTDYTLPLCLSATPQLYLRLQGASRHELSITHELQSPAKRYKETNCPLTNLPKDVMLSFVAPYLRARSLDALRCSCSYMHCSLRSIVPGLKLRLYRHQIKSLDWMRRRETRQLLEKHVLNSHCIDGNTVDGDLHRAVSGGASTCLSFRPESVKKYSNIRIDPQYGSADKVKHILRSGVSRKVARGGLLCDDPGLGKTITVLSLILQTFGLTATKLFRAKTGQDDAKLSSSCHLDEVFNAYWKEQVVPCFRIQNLNKLLNTLVRENKRDSMFFLKPVDPAGDGCPDYLDVIERPISFADISRWNQQDMYKEDFDRFCSDVELCFSNAMTYNPDTHPIYQAAYRLSEKFKLHVEMFKSNNVRSAKKSFSSAVAKPNSSVASILEERSKTKLIDSLVPSSATLLVVPSVLLPHWEEQLSLYLDPSYCTDKIPIVFHYGDKDRHQGTHSMPDVKHLTKMNSTHFPLVFVDHASTKKLPSPEFLAMFSVVITTNQRLSNEWKHGSFSDELRNQDSDGMRLILTNPGDEACPLLKVRWLRLIVDEGHAMGRGTHNNAIRFASWIEAERRWAMTGTPTPQTVSQNGLTNLLGLMRFLQHDFFSTKLDGDKVWQHCIIRSWKEGNLAAFFRLRSLLLLFMVRHTKRDIEELSPPKFQRTFSVMSQEEVTAYNTLVCAIQSNLITTAMEGKTSGLQDSLLHRRQSKHARKAFNNVRLACSGGTRVVPTLTQHNWDETFAILKEDHGVKGVKLDVVANFLHRAVTEQLSGCMCCGLQLSTLMVLPCGDLICTECIDSQTRACPVCDKPFDVDQFQLLQPGIEYTWKFNLEEEKEKETKRGMRRRNVEITEPVVGIQAGPDAQLGAQHWNAELAGIVPMQPAPEIQRRTRRRGDGHMCEYDPAAIDGKCKFCLEEHEDCVLPSRQSKCHVCFRTPEPCPQEESKFFYVTNRLEQLLASQKQNVHHTSGAASRLIGESVVADDTRPVKVILFSQFRPILDLVGHRLLRRFGAGCVAEYWGYARKQELAKFTKSRDCFCMLLGKDGSEGLDLSFVTHIFFLDQVWDKSLENQVVARAYRMGAKGHVKVETLVAKQSVEQTMVQVEESIAANRTGVSLQGGEFNGVELASLSGTAKEYQNAKLQFLLKNLSLIKKSDFVRRKRVVQKKRSVHLETNEEDKWTSLIENSDHVGSERAGMRKRKGTCAHWKTNEEDGRETNGEEERRKKVRFMENVSVMAMP